MTVNYSISRIYEKAARLDNLATKMKEKKSKTFSWTNYLLEIPFSMLFWFGFYLEALLDFLFNF